PPEAWTSVKLYTLSDVHAKVPHVSVPQFVYSSKLLIGAALAALVCVAALCGYAYAQANRILPNGAAVLLAHAEDVGARALSAASLFASQTPVSPPVGIATSTSATTTTTNFVAHATTTN